MDLSLALKGSVFSGNLMGVGGAAGFVITIPIDPVISPIVGIVSMLIVGAVVEFSKDEDEVKAQIRKQVEKAVEEKRPGMLESALSPLREYEAQSAREFSAKIGQRIGGFDDILEDARDALWTTREENEARRVRLEKARAILLDAGGRCKTRLLPEAVDSIA
jgi:hypothetical protein